ncbi:MAG: hypothetical protein KF760_15565 [Candidatus Eremiobacteraeota bacterium]|nr:hypothetical protein [Candidatus Eremiobacteraeota bacterium]MCW5869304.1 hypothetical protein [Candidatus Eremiobacteraeota bacterium]
MSAHFDFINGMMSLLKVVVAGDWISCIPSPSEDLGWPSSPAYPDLVTECYRENHGSLVVSHYSDGAVRWENVHSGVIREESADGSMTLSLPDGKIIRQAFAGGPLQVVDLENPRPVMVAHLMQAHIQETPSAVYHYEDPQSGHYIIERDTLRFFQVVDINFFRLVP